MNEVNHITQHGCWRTGSHFFFITPAIFKRATVNGLPVLTNYKHYITHNAAQQDQVWLPSSSLGYLHIFSSLFLFLKKYRKLLLKMKGKCCVVHALCIIEHASLQKGFCHTSLWIQMKTAFSGFIAIFQKQCTTCIENNNSGGICVHFCIKYTVKKWTFNALLQLLTR